MSLIKKENIRQSNNVRVLGQQNVSVNMSANEDEDNKNNQASGSISVEDYIKSSNEYKLEYKNLIKQAEREAQKIKEAALKDIEEQRLAAIKSGLAEGEQKGYNKIAENIKKSSNIIRQAQEQRNNIIKSNEPETLKLAVKIAREIIKKEMIADQTIIMQILEEAIEKISDNEQVVIKVSHNDLQEVRNHKDRIIDLVEAKNLSIVSDKHIEDGGCVIETKLGYIDAKIKTKLEIIEEGLLGVYEEDKVKEETLGQEQKIRKELNEGSFQDEEQEDETVTLDDDKLFDDEDLDLSLIEDDSEDDSEEEPEDEETEDELDDDFTDDFEEDEKDNL